MGAWLGAVGLATGFLTLGGDLNHRLPYQSPVFGGIALALIVAAPFTVLGTLAWRRDPRAGLVAAASGLLLMGWIIVELAFLREVSFFHPLYFVIGLVFLLVGRRGVADGIHALRPSP